MQESSDGYSEVSISVNSTVMSVDGILSAVAKVMEEVQVVDTLEGTRICTFRLRDMVFAMDLNDSTDWQGEPFLNALKNLIGVAKAAQS